MGFCNCTAVHYWSMSGRQVLKQAMFGPSSHKHFEGCFLELLLDHFIKHHLRGPERSPSSASSSATTARRARSPSAR